MQPMALVELARRIYAPTQPLAADASPWFFLSVAFRLLSDCRESVSKHSSNSLVRIGISACGGRIPYSSNNCTLSSALPPLLQLVASGYCRRLTATIPLQLAATVPGAWLLLPLPSHQPHREAFLQPAL